MDNDVKVNSQELSPSETTVPIPNIIKYTQKEIEDAHILQEAIQSELGNITNKAFNLGLMLMTFKKNNCAIALGYNSFNDWITHPHIGIGKQTAYTYIRMARNHLRLQKMLGEKYDPRLMMAINIQKYKIIMKKMEGENNPDKLLEILHEAQTNSTMDLIAHYGNQEVILRGYGIFSKMIGKYITITNIVLPYDISNQSWFKIFGKKKVKFVIKLDDSDEQNENQMA